jgi:hypothetical protein
VLMLEQFDLPDPARVLFGVRLIASLGERPLW